MHEMGTILHLIDSTEKLCARYNVSRLGYVKIEVGKLADAVPQYLYQLWPMGTQGTICEGTELIIVTTEATAKCDKCHKEYPVMDNLADDNLPVCPYCGHHHYKITEGAEITITELGVEN